MQTLIKHLVVLIIAGVSMQLSAQDTIQSQSVKYKIEYLKNQKEKIEKEERDNLKAEVETINQRLEDGQITEAEAEALKTDMAKKRALNIENRIAIIDNKISLLTRNDDDYTENVSSFEISIGNPEGGVSGIKFKGKNKARKYDRRTFTELVYAAGSNNAIIDGVSFGKSPYSFGRSGFAELGLTWNTRLFKESNAVRLKYGFSFQWNKYNVKDNKYFLQNGSATTLETFPVDLSESELRLTNLVFSCTF